MVSTMALWKIPWESKQIMLSIKEFAINPLSPTTSSPHCSSYIAYGAAWENLFYHHNSSSLVITSFILKTSLFDQTVLLLGEIAFGSLLGLKGLRCKIHQYTKKLIFNTTGTDVFQDLWVFATQASHVNGVLFKTAGLRLKKISAQLIL